jgi:hypothetical protein
MCCVQCSLAHVRLLRDERVTLCKANKSIAMLLEEFALRGTSFLRGFRHRGKIRDRFETLLICSNHISECAKGTGNHFIVPLYKNATVWHSSLERVLILTQCESQSRSPIIDSINSQHRGRPCLCVVAPIQARKAVSLPCGS